MQISAGRQAGADTLAGVDLVSYAFESQPSCCAAENGSNAPNTMSVRSVLLWICTKSTTLTAFQCAAIRNQQGCSRLVWLWVLAALLNGLKEQTMTAHKCDYCRGALGLIAPRYWGMRFCSKVHKQAYQRRLAEETRAKFGTSPTSPTAVKRGGSQSEPLCDVSARS